MIFSTDESGGFNLGRQGFESSLMATLVCPPSERPCLEAFVAERLDAWDLPELHAQEMSPDQRREVAGFLGAQDSVIWTATLIDSETFPASTIGEWRADQVATFDSTFAESDARGTTHPEYVGRGPELRRLLANKRVVPTPSFVQFGIVAPRHVHDTVQAAVRRFAGPRWANDWRQPKLVFDEKNAGGEDNGEKLIKATLMPILASGKMALSLPIDYQDPKHPLRGVHGSERGINLRSMFGGTPEFVSSDSDPLVQLADMIGWVAHRALRTPDDADAQAAYRLLRRRQFESTSARFRIMGRRDLHIEDLGRYRHLLPA